MPKQKPLIVRLSATDWVKDGWDIHQSIVFCNELKKIGCEIIHVSSGGLSPLQKIQIGPGYQCELSSIIKKQVGSQTIAVGMITDPIQAESILRRKFTLKTRMVIQQIGMAFLLLLMATVMINDIGRLFTN